MVKSSRKSNNLRKGRKRNSFRKNKRNRRRRSIMKGGEPPLGMPGNPLLHGTLGILPQACPITPAAAALGTLAAITATAVPEYIQEGVKSRYQQMIAPHPNDCDNEPQVSDDECSEPENSDWWKKYIRALTFAYWLSHLHSNHYTQGDYVPFDIDPYINV